MTLRWLTWVLAALLLAAIGTGIWLLRPPFLFSSPPDSPPPDSPPPARPRPSAERAAGKPPAPRMIRARGGRIPIPRLRALPPEAAPGNNTHPLEGGHAQLFDRRPDPGPDSDDLRSRLRARLRTVDDAAEACLGRYAQEDPDLAAGVMLVFSLDARGLQRVWIEDRAEIADGPLSCLSGAVYGVDWRGLTREPIELSRRMRTRPDAGPAR